MIKKMASRFLSAQQLMKLANYWPPFLGAGIKIKHIADDFHRMEVEMKLTKMNTNYVGVHFGGSLYAMSDAFYMLMLIQILGKGFVVWDKAATIQFKRPGKGTVRATFELTHEQVEGIRMDALDQGKTERTLKVSILDGHGHVVAEVDKVLWIATKEYASKRKKT